MLGYFFTPERDLPANVGFAPLGKAHLLLLGALGVGIAVFVRLACRMEVSRRLRLLRGVCVSMVVLELVKDLILALQGAFSVGYLPLHLCSMAMFICLFWAYRPAWDGAGQCLYSLCLSGGVAALLFPDWSRMPLWHFQSLHSFVYHALLVAVPLIAVCSGMVRPGVSKVWKPMAFLLAAAVPVYGLDLLLGTNFMFLRYPVAGTPLELCARCPGGYLLGFGLLAAAVLVLLNLPFSLWGQWKRRKTRRKNGSI